MIRPPLAVALTTLGIASTANAGFTFSVTDQGTISGYSVVLIRAINDGVGTGTELDGYDLTFTMNPGTTAHFNVTDENFDGTPDTADLVNVGNPNAGFMRVGSSATTSIVYTSPSRGPTQPNPWDAISTWSIAAISTGWDNATGNGAIIARLFLTSSYTFPSPFSFTGQIGGNEGSAVPVSYGISEPLTVHVDPDTVTVDLNSATGFGPVEVAVTGGLGVATLDAGTIPAQIADNISITGSTFGPLEVNGFGFTAADVGTYTIDFTALGVKGSTDTETLTVNVVIPEPATFGLLAGLSLSGLRRR